MTSLRQTQTLPAASPLATLLAHAILRVARLTPLQLLGWLRGDWVGACGGRCFSAKGSDGSSIHCAFLPANSPLPSEGEGKPLPSGAGEGWSSLRTGASAPGGLEAVAKPPLPRGSEGEGWGEDPSLSSHSVVGPTTQSVSPRRLPVISLHGWWQVQETQIAPAAMLRAQGHDVLIPGLRCHGRSGGRCVTFGFQEKQDLLALLDQAQSLGLIGDKVLSMGLSLGAGTALQHAAVDPRVAGVVALAPFLDMASAVESYRRIYGPWFNTHWVARGFAAASRREGFDMAEASTLHAMPHIAAPVLLAVGQSDRNLSAVEHTRVLAAAKTSGSCKLIEVPVAHHFNLHRGPWPGLNQAIVQFLAAASGERVPSS